MNKYKTTITSMAIHLNGESPIYGESAVVVHLADEAAGIYLSIRDGVGGTISVDIEQWDLLTKAVKELTAQKCVGM